MRQERACGRRVGGQHRDAGRPFGGHQLLNGEAVPRVPDRGLQAPRERDGAEPDKQLVPAFHDAGHVDRERSAGRHLGEPAPRELFGRRPVCGTAARIEPVYALRRRVVDQREQVATDAGHRRLHDGEHGRRRHRSVDRVAAVLQRSQSCGRGERLAGGNHSRSPHCCRARAPQVAIRTITRDRFCHLGPFCGPFYLRLESPYAPACSAAPARRGRHGLAAAQQIEPSAISDALRPALAPPCPSRRRSPTARAPGGAHRARLDGHAGRRPATCWWTSSPTRRTPAIASGP